MLFFLKMVSLGLGSLITLGNGYAVFQQIRHQIFVSTVPLTGGLLLFWGLTGFALTRPFAWLALFLDLGTLLFFLGLPNLIKQLLSSRISQQSQATQNHLDQSAKPDQPASK